MSDVQHPLYSEAWFAYTFENATPMPPQIRKAAERVCREYDIRGICDPLYVANCIASEIGAGDGRSVFTLGPLHVTEEHLDEMVRFLRFAYSSTIGGPAEELKKILATELCPSPQWATSP